MTIKPRIKDKIELQAEIDRLKLVTTRQRELIRDDIEHLKQEYTPSALMEKFAASIVPAPIRHASGVNDTINFVAKNIFGSNKDVVSEGSDKGKGNRTRNMVLGVAEGALTWIVGRYVKRHL